MEGPASARPSGLTLVALGGLGSLAGLWSLGLFATPPRGVFALLLMGGAACGSVLLGASGLRRRQGTRGGALVAPGAICLAGSVAFGGVLFLAPSPPRVTRRVALPAVPPASLRVLDYNVRHGYPDLADQRERERTLRGCLGRLAPDLILLQESWSTAGRGRLAERLGEALGLDVAYARANGSRRLLGFEEGLAVLSRFPVRAAERRVLAPRRPVWERRIALRVRLGLSPGEELTVVVLHLTHRRPAVARQQAEAAADWAATAQLVGGDLNAAAGSPVVEVLTRQGLVDILPGGIDHVLLPALGPWGPTHARWTLDPGEVAALTGERRALSDHPALLVELARRE